MIAALLLSCVAQVESLEVGESRPIEPLVLGVNQSLHTAAEHPESLWTAYELLGPTVVRYPGGTIASLWDTGSDRFVPVEQWEERLGRRPLWVDWTQWQARSINRRLSQPAGRASLAAALDPVAFAERAAAIGAEVSWVLNLATDEPPSGDFAADPPAGLVFLRRLKAAGVPVRLVELGNELEGDSFNRRFPTVEDYFAEIDPLAKAIRAEFPDVRLAACSHVPMIDALESDANNPAGEAGRHAAWAERTLRRDDGYDLVNHTYLGGRGLEPALGLKPYVLAVRREAADPLLGVDFVLQSPQHMAAAAEAALAEAPAGKRIWQTEYNLWTVGDDPFARYAGTPTQALYLVAWQLEMLARPHVFAVAHTHSLLGDEFGVFGLPGDRDGTERGEGAAREGDRNESAQNKSAQNESAQNESAQNESAQEELARTDGEVQRPVDVAIRPAANMLAALASLAEGAETVAPVGVRGHQFGELLWSDTLPDAVRGVLLTRPDGERRLALVNLTREPVTISLAELDTSAFWHLTLTFDDRGAHADGTFGEKGEQSPAEAMLATPSRQLSEIAAKPEPLAIRALLSQLPEWFPAELRSGLRFQFVRGTGSDKAKVKTELPPYSVNFIE